MHCAKTSHWSEPTASTPHKGGQTTCPECRGVPSTATAAAHQGQSAKRLKLKRRAPAVASSPHPVRLAPAGPKAPQKCRDLHG